MTLREEIFENLDNALLNDPQFVWNETTVLQETIELMTYTDLGDRFNIEDVAPWVRQWSNLQGTTWK